MNITDIKWLYDYNYWANHLIVSSASALSPEQLTTPTRFSYGSLQGTLEHILDAEYVWRDIFENERFTTRLVDIETFPTLESIKIALQKEESAMRAYIDGLNDDDLHGILEYSIPEGCRKAGAVALSGACGKSRHPASERMRRYVDRLRSLTRRPRHDPLSE